MFDAKAGPGVLCVVDVVGVGVGAARGGKLV